MWRFLPRPIGFAARKGNLLRIIDHDFYMGMTAAKTGKHFLKLIGRNICVQTNTWLRLLLGLFLNSLLIFVQKAIQPLHQKPAEQEH